MNQNFDFNGLSDINNQMQENLLFQQTTQDDLSAEENCLYGMDQTPQQTSQLQPNVQTTQTYYNLQNLFQTQQNTGINQLYNQNASSHNNHQLIKQQSFGINQAVQSQQTLPNTTQNKPNDSCINQSHILNNLSQYEINEENEDDEQEQENQFKNYDVGCV